MSGISALFIKKTLQSSLASSSMRDTGQSDQAGWTTLAPDLGLPVSRTEGSKFVWKPLPVALCCSCLDG